MEAVAEHELSVVLSSHLVSDLERVCDYLVVLVDSRVRLAGDVDDAARHAPPAHRAAPRPGHAARPTSRSSRPATPTGRRTLLVRTDGPILDPAWTVEPVGLEDLVLAYMRQAGDGRPRRADPRWRCCDDLADLAPVPRLRPRVGLRRARRGRGRRSPSPARGLADYYASGIAGLHAGRRLRRRHRRSSATTQRVPAPSEPRSCSLLSRPLIGVFWGAPLVARELETGTLPARLEPERHPHPLAGRQARPSSAWPAWPPPACSASLVDLVVQPDRHWSTPTASRRTVFGARGIVPLGYAAFAFALGVTAGVLIRRTLPAMAVTLVGFVAVRLSFAFWVRPHLLAPLTSSQPLDEPGDAAAAGRRAGRRRREVDPLPDGHRPQRRRHRHHPDRRRTTLHGHPQLPERLPRDDGLPAGRPLLDLPVVGDGHLRRPRAWCSSALAYWWLRRRLS